MKYSITYTQEKENLCQNRKINMFRQDYVERIGVSCWAYISDLLPKGGEK